MQLSFLAEAGAFSYDESTETYRVDLEKMERAVNDLASVILTIQGDGDYVGLGAFMEKHQVTTDRLRESLDRLAAEGIPVDIVFEQGPAVLGL